MKRLFLIILIALIIAAGWFAYALYAPYQGFPQEGVFVDIPHGASGRTIARLLVEKGVVRSRLAFEGLLRWHAGNKLIAGEYFFNRPVTSFDVFETIAEGRVYTQPLVVPEGYNMFDIADLVQKQGFSTTRQEFLDAARDPAWIRDLAPEAKTLEGFLFPATYQFGRHATAQEITRTMVDRFRQTWQSLAATAPEAGARPVEETVTMASLVERETPVRDERPMVAAVFYNRLRRGMALQCDPTVAYALALAGRYSGALDSGDLNFDSPYNTYRHAGLPPGPIANPGEASLRAALAPAPVDYLYFVANTQGGHFFSKTLEEHNRNVVRYRRLLAQNGAQNSSTPKDPAQKGARENGATPANKADSAAPAKPAPIRHKKSRSQRPP